MKALRRPFAFAAVLAVFLVAPTTHALPKKPAAKPVAPPAPPVSPTPPSPPTLAETLTGEAQADYASGKVLYADGDYANALLKFSSAYDRSKEVQLLWNMAACDKNLRHYARSVRLLRQYLKGGDATLTDADKNEARELVNVMEPFTATLQVNVDEPDAEVSIDDEPIGTSPAAPVLVDIGTRKLRVRKEGFEELVKEVPVGGAAKVTLGVTLVKIVHEGRLSVRASKEATVTLDGHAVGTGAWSGIVKSGGHTLRVTAPKMRVYQTEVLIQDRQSREVSVTLEPEPNKGVPAWAWVAGSVVLAGGLATGGYFLFRGQDKYEGPEGNITPGVVQASAPIRFR